jgi:hypothetical protein
MSAKLVKALRSFTARWRASRMERNMVAYPAYFILEDPALARGLSIGIRKHGSTQKLHGARANRGAT